MKDKDDKCDLCEGKGEYMDGRCTFCNGTGEWTSAAQAFVNNHICQCITLDRINCPVCHKPCHHDTSLHPKQKIEPGGGGIGFIDTSEHADSSTTEYSSLYEHKEEDVIA